MIKEILKNFASKIGIGFCYGIGISLAVLTIFYAYENIASEDHDYDKYRYADEKDQSKLKIGNHKIVFSEEHRLEIIGTVINESDFDWTGVELEIELFDESGTFVYECNYTIKSTIKTSQSEHFKAECSNCGRQIPAYSDYKIKVVRGYGKRLKK